MTEQALEAPHARAIVIGAGMVGMATARALSERFREVVVVEKDVLPRDSVEHRRGVQQSWHVHNLYARGQQELDELFPGFTEEALRLGALQLDYGRDSARCTFEGFCPLFNTGFLALSGSRQLLETAQRRRFLALCDRVTLIEGARVTGLKTKVERSQMRACGVTTDHPEHAEIEGDLVVDCSGRAALWKGWFDELHIPKPKMTRVDSKTGYASRFYTRPEGNPYPWKAMSVDAIYPDKPRWGVIVPLEHGTWIVTIGAFNGNYPPSDEEGFKAFGEALQTPLFSEWMRGAEPAGPVRTFRKIDKKWHHFERYDHPLGNFLAVGDSAFAFNPLYGQGMTIGVTCARILRDTLRESADLESLARRFYPAAHAFAFPPWKSTALIDLSWPKTEGERPWYTELNRRMMRIFLRAAQYEDDVFVSFLQVAHLIKQPLQFVQSWKVVKGLMRFCWQAATGTLPPQSFAAPPLRAVNAAGGAHAQAQAQAQAGESSPAESQRHA